MTGLEGVGGVGLGGNTQAALDWERVLRSQSSDSSSDVLSKPLHESSLWMLLMKHIEPQTT